MPSPAFDPRRPFRRRTALAAGLTDHQLRSPAFRHLFRDCFVASTAPMTPALRAEAALLMRPDAQFVSHGTAARLLGGVVPEDPDTHLGTTADLRSRRDGVVLHRYATRPQLVRRHGLAVTSAATTFADLAAELSLVDQVILGDSLVRRRHITPDELRRASESATGRGARAARRSAELVRAEVDSPQETRTRLLLVLAGLPEPDVNIVLRKPNGDVRRRIDLGYRAARLAIEYDGRQHIRREEAWVSDIARREELETEGWRFVVLIADDLYVTPGATVDRVVRAMVSAGMRPPRLRDDWMRHFPSRAAA
ncbi:DUF559 domain-containing protein [Luteipulveratus sp. YIM 133132]|uniref:DUF559 domain-containing protein n=1 Tax=Luteipulveratus flavus TaxID=3031728 RepID=UPI0023AF3700|nr:DUF559 domain-containing protein [Luteipulveratus sp. YIM 133132]MDE9367191.1 DUF559 domain-containing protein [Luteipulveratus sp. YIM 133132]